MHLPACLTVACVTRSQSSSLSPLHVMEVPCAIRAGRACDCSRPAFCAGGDSSGGTPAVPPPGSMTPQQRQEHVHKQQRWLLFLRHCAKCQLPDGQCQYGQSCSVAKQLWRHILACADPGCNYPRCCCPPACQCSGLCARALTARWHGSPATAASADCPCNAMQIILTWSAFHAANCLQLDVSRCHSSRVPGPSLPTSASHGMVQVCGVAGAAEASSEVQRCELRGVHAGQKLCAAAAAGADTAARPHAATASPGPGLRKWQCPAASAHACANACAAGVPDRML